MKLKKSVKASKKQSVNEDWTDSNTIHQGLVSAERAYQQLQTTDKEAANNYQPGYNLLVTADAALGAIDSINATDDEMQKAQKLQQYANAITRVTSPMQSSYSTLVQFIEGNKGSLPSQLGESYDPDEDATDDTDSSDLPEPVDDIPDDDTDDQPADDDVIRRVIDGLTTLIDSSIINTVDPKYAQDMISFLNTLRTLLTLYSAGDEDSLGALDQLRSRLHDANMVMYGVNTANDPDNVANVEPDDEKTASRLHSEVTDDSDWSDPAPKDDNNTDYAAESAPMYKKLLRGHKLVEADLDVPDADDATKRENIDTWLATRLSYADRIADKNKKKVYTDGMKYVAKLVKQTMPSVVEQAQLGKLSKPKKVHVQSGDILAFSADNVSSSEFNMSVNTLKDLDNLKVVGDIPGLNGLSVVTGDDYAKMRDFDGNLVNDTNQPKDVYTFLRSGKKVIAYFFVDPELAHPSSTEDTYDVTDKGMRDAAALKAKEANK